MIRAFKRIPLAVKLPASILLLALAATVAVGVTGYLKGRDALIEAAKTRIVAVAQSRVEALNATFKSYATEVGARAGDQSVRRGLLDLKAAFERLKASENPYDFLQKEYITDNPNPPAERWKVDQGATYNAYNIAHKRVHQTYAAMVMSGTFYDVFLIAPDGDVLYTVAKEADFATNILTGPWKDSGLSRIVAKIAAQPVADQVEFSDTEAYAPSNGVPAAFAAAPVFGPDGKLAGIFAVQLSISAIDECMQRRSGLGETGLSVLVSSEGLLLSDTSRDMPPDILTGRVPKDLIANADPAGVKVWTAPGIDGSPSVVATAPVKKGDYNYMVVVSQSLEEVMGPVHTMRWSMVQGSFAALAAIGLIGFFLGRSVTRPIRAAAATVSDIGAGDYTTEVAGLTRGDELGLMARSLAEVRDTLASGAAAAREAAFKSSALESASAALMMVDGDYNIKHINPAAAKLLSALAPDIRKLNPAFSVDTLIGTNIDVFHAAPDRNRRMLQVRDKMPMEAEIKLGNAQIGLVIAEVMREGEGTLGMVIEWKDVTQDRQNRAILDALDRSQAMMLFDADGKALSVNGKLREWAASSDSAILGRSCADVLAPVAGTAALTDVWDRLRRGESVFGRFTLSPAGGREVLLEGGFGPILDRAGKLMRVSFLGNDVTEAEASLRRAAEAQEKLQAAQKRVVDQLRLGLSRLAEGDLTNRLEQAFEADYETLRADFNTSVERLSEAISAVVDNAQSIQGEVKEISNAADDLSRRTEKQAATLEQTAAALDQLTSSVQSAADGAADANRVVEDARKSAEISGTVVQETVSAMAEISSSSDRISKIIGVIDDIAFQTNLLALNAGVEAARAGEAGRGFAVVASEVRALAQRSSDAAREINDLISASSAQVRRGVGLVGQAGDALKGIVQSVSNIAIRVSDIAASAKEQSVGLAEINSAVNQLDQVTQQNVAMFEETSAASHALSREAEALSATTARFQVPATQAAPARAATPAPARKPAPVRSAAPAPRSNGALAEASPHEDWHEF